MTPCSAACGGRCSRRPARGRPGGGPPPAARARRGARAARWPRRRISSNSPSSSWIALSCWRRTNSRWLRSSSDWTFSWMPVPIEMTSSSRASTCARRRRRSVTSRSSRSACFSSVGMPQRRGDEVAERGGVVDVGDGDLQLLGQVRDLLDDRRERRLHVAHERGELGRRRVVELGDLLDLGREVGLLLRPAHDADAAAALHEQPQRAVGHAQHARDDADDADVVEVVRAGRLEVGLARRDHHERAVAARGCR